MQFQSAQKDFLRYCAEERRLSHHSIAAYEFDLLDFRRWLPRGTEPGAVSEEDLKGYLGSMVIERSLSAATVRRRLACLRSFFSGDFAELGQSKDPFVAWRPKLPRRKRLPRALSRPESIVLCSSPTSPDSDAQMRVAFRLIVATGIRVGELCAIQLSDVSPDCAVIRIHGKGSRDRVVYVTDSALRQGLKCLIVTRRAQGLPSLLVNRFGSLMKPQSVRAKLRKFARQLGLERRVTPHMLRHTAATLLIETGVDIRFVQRLLGHSSIATTEIYTHVTDEALRVALERANVLASLGGPPTQA